MEAGTFIPGNVQPGRLARQAVIFYEVLFLSFEESFMNGNELPKIRHVSSWWNECIAKNQNLLPRQLIDKLVKLSGNGISCFGEGPIYR